MIIKPITVRLIAYGQKANVAAIRIRATELFKDEHGTRDQSGFIDISAVDAHAEILTNRLDQDVALKKPSASRVGISITLPDMNERLTVEWLHELPVAKTCVAFAAWSSHREGLAWQLLIVDGSRWSESRPLT